MGSVDEIDEAMKAGAAHPMGPLTLSDFVGLDTLGSICDVMFDEFRERRFAQPPTLRKMLAAGWYGQKSGMGFYDWSGDDAGAEPAAGLAAAALSGWVAIGHRCHLATTVQQLDARCRLSGSGRRADSRAIRDLSGRRGSSGGRPRQRYRRAAALLQPQHRDRARLGVHRLDLAELARGLLAHVSRRQGGGGPDGGGEGGSPGPRPRLPCRRRRQAAGSASGFSSTFSSGTTLAPVPFVSVSSTQTLSPCPSTLAPRLQVAVR